MRRYLIHSALFHFSLLAFLAWAPWFRSKAPILWIDSFDFDGGGGGGGGGGGPKAQQMGQIVPQPVKIPIPEKPAPVQHAMQGEELWKIKNEKEKKIVKEEKAPSEIVERGGKTQKEETNIVRRGIADGTVAGEGSYDFGPGGPGSGTGIGIGVGPGTGGGFGFGSYLRIVRSRIWAEWTQSAVYGSKLSCVVGLTVVTNGDVSNIRLEKSSGNAFYDNVSMRAVRNAAPLPPLPPNFPASEQRFNIQFRLQD